MKKLLFALSVLLITNVLFAQNTIDTTPPYKRSPFVPPIKLLETDSVSFFTKADLKKNKPVLIMLFNPECDHCKHETEEIIKHIDELKKVQIVMATMASYSSMKEFYQKFKLSDFDNIQIGKDVQNMLPSFYRVSFLPFLAMYNKKGDLLATFEGTMKIEDLVKMFE